MKKCIIICNPNSGKGVSKKELMKCEELLNKNDYSVLTYITKYPGHAQKIMYEIEDADLVLSLGGDGTFNEVMTGNFKREKQLVLSHVPTGTTNDIGVMFGLTKSFIYNLGEILKGEIKEMDICTINNQPFVYVAGYGKFMTMPYDTPRNMKKNFGYLAYVLRAIKDFMSTTSLVELSYNLNNQTYKGLYSFILISNATRIAGVNDIYKDVKLDDNQFEVLFCNLRKRKDIIKSLYYLRTNDITKVPGLYFHRTNNLTIRFTRRPRKPWCIDGEKFDERVNEYHINVEKKVKVLLPKKELSKLFDK